MDTTLRLDDGRTVKLRVRSPESYTPNLLNTNQGQERGKAALDDSLQKSGFHRGIVVAKDDQVVNGNHAYQSASELGVVKSWIEVEVEGDVGIVTKRLDWETAQDPKAIVAAIADNRTSELNFSIDTEAFQQALDVLAEVGLELPKTLYTEAELNKAIDKLGSESPEYLSPSSWGNSELDKLERIISDGPSASKFQRVNDDPEDDSEEDGEVWVNFSCPVREPCKSIIFDALKKCEGKNNLDSIGDRLTAIAQYYLINA